MKAAAASVSSHSRRDSGAIMTRASAASFRRALLANMVTGMKATVAGGGSYRSMSFPERVRLVRASADVALATARGGRAWSAALVDATCKGDPRSRVLVKAIAGREYYCEEDMLMNAANPLRHRHGVKVPMWRKIVKRGLKRRRRALNAGSRRPRVRKGGAGRGTAARSLAERIVRRRTQVLKRLVPGGESLDDECSLLGETLDYIVSLRAQVEVMKSLTETMELFSDSSCFVGKLPQGDDLAAKAMS